MLSARADVWVAYTISLLFSWYYLAFLAANIKSAQYILIQYSLNTREFPNLNLMITGTVKRGWQSCPDSPVTVTPTLFLVSAQKTDCPKHVWLKSLFSSPIIHPNPNERFQLCLSQNILKYRVPHCDQDKIPCVLYIFTCFFWHTNHIYSVISVYIIMSNVKAKARLIY